VDLVALGAADFDTRAVKSVVLAASIMPEVVAAAVKI
jgi:hypothetical protein